jgi:hypothetical protein
MAGKSNPNPQKPTSPKTDSTKSIRGDVQVGGLQWAGASRNGPRGTVGGENRGMNGPVNNGANGSQPATPTNANSGAKPLSNAPLPSTPAPPPRKK